MCTYTVPVVRCSSTEYSDGKLKITLDHHSETLPANKLTVIFTRVNSTWKERRLLDANNMTIALAHGDLDPGSYTVDVEAKNNIGVSWAHCQDMVHHFLGGMCKLCTPSQYHTTLFLIWHVRFSTYFKSNNHN